MNILEVILNKITLAHKHNAQESDACTHHAHPLVDLENRVFIYFLWLVYKWNRMLGPLVIFTLSLRLVARVCLSKMKLKHNALHCDAHTHKPSHNHSHDKMQFE